MTGDPHRHFKKTLKVGYRYLERLGREAFDENKHIELPAESALSFRLPGLLTLKAERSVTVIG